MTGGRGQDFHILLGDTIQPLTDSLTYVEADLPAVFCGLLAKTSGILLGHQEEDGNMVRGACCFGVGGRE